MNEISILTPGEKVKSIRTKLGLKQQEIAGTEITRNMISYIENNKVSLTTQVAAIVCKNINSICQERGIDFSITEDYLLESVEEQMELIVSEYTNYFQNTKSIIKDEFHAKVTELDKIFASHSIPKLKLKIYSLIGEIYENNNSRNKAYNYFLKAYENSSKLINPHDQVNILSHLVKLCILLEKYVEALNYCELSEVHHKIIDEKLLYAFYFNKALSLKKLGNYSECIIEIDKIHSLFQLSGKEYYNVSILKSNCHYEQKQYSEAIKINSKLVNKIDDNNIDYKLLVLANTLEILVTLNDIISIKEYLSTCIANLKVYEKKGLTSYSQSIYSSIALAYKKLNNVEMQKKYLFRALIECKKFKYISFLVSTFENLLDIAIEEKNSELLNDLRNDILECISQELIPPYNKLILKLISYYNCSGEKENIQSLLNFVL